MPFALSFFIFAFCLFPSDFLPPEANHAYSHQPQPLTLPAPCRSIWKRSLTWLLNVMLVLLDVPLPTSRASSFTALGPEDFVRSTGAPVQETRTFTITNPGLPYLLRLYNGGQQGQYCPVSSATVIVNGRTIFSQNNFNPHVTLLEAPVVLAASNTVVVELRSKPGCGITLNINGDNTAPVANAGPDQSGRVNTTVTLDGSESSDADGDDLTYQWTFATKPTGSTATLSSATAVRPTFLLDKASDYVVRLVVHDGREASAPDTVTISSINSKPVAEAGPDQTGLVGDTLTLDGTASSDVDGDALVFQWRVVSKPATSTAVVTNGTAVRPTLVLDVPGTYTVELVVNDGVVNSDPDQVTISTLNSKPVAEAGGDLSYPLGSTVTLDGSDSTDVDGDRLSYLWALTTVPAGSTATLSDRGAVRPTFVIDKPGLYTAQLLVNDGELESEADTVTLSTVNSKPTADAGVDQHGAVNTTITLDGRGSDDPDNDPLAYEWSILTKPLGSTAAVSAPTVVQPTFTLDKAGTYTIQLIVRDGKLDSTPDMVTVSTLNSRPVADAGADQIGRIGVQTTLDGTRSRDADGDALEYFWALTSQPAGSTATLFNDTGATPAFVPDLGGLYVVQLFVNDGQLDSDPVTLVITVPDPTLSDDDGDGVTEREGDCNDARATIYPGAPELPNNGIDENCDGVDSTVLDVGLTPSASSVRVGQTLTITISVPGLESVTPQQMVSAFDLDVRYAPGTLQFTSLVFGTSLAPSFQMSRGDTPGLIDVAELSRQTEAGLGQQQGDRVTLVTLTFTALAVGTSPVELVPHPRFGQDIKGLLAQVLPLPLSTPSLVVTVTP